MSFQSLTALFLFVVSVSSFLTFSHGLVRIFDFPRLQILAVTFLVILWSMVTANPMLPVTIFLCLAVILIQGWHIMKFLPIWPGKGGEVPHDVTARAGFSLMVSNVKQGNMNHDALISQIEQYNPDIVILMEMNKAWDEAIKPVKSSYPNRLEYPQENTYGMVLLSRFEFEAKDVKFLINQHVPSMHVDLVLEPGLTLRLVAVHPEPPLPHEDTLERDAEICEIGKLSRNFPRPLVIAGDLNDVAWSRTTRRFMRISGLLDPREGRGMFNTFDARYPFLRWPLDHVFHSPDLVIRTIKRLPFMGSDHFPMFYEFFHAPTNGNEEPEKPKTSDFKEADEVIRKGRSQEKKPVGANWED